MFRYSRLCVAHVEIGFFLMSEEVSEGHVGWPALKLLFSNMRGRGGFLVFWATFSSLLLLSRLGSTLQTWILALWAGEYDDGHQTEVPVAYYLSLYAIVVAASFAMYSLGWATYVFGSLRASRSIHQLLVDSIFGTTLRWLDTTPAARVIAQCTQDVQALDGPVVNSFIRLLDQTLMMLTKFFAVIAFSPIFSVPGAFLAAVGVYTGNIYMKAQLPVKREMSNAKAPVLGHFGAAIAGLVSIRAYGAQEAFRQESFKRIDNFSRASRIYWHLNRWISIRTDALAGIFASSLGAYLLYGGGGASASQMGFSLTMAVGFSSMFLLWVRLFNFFETNGNSLERILQYTQIEQEEKPSEDGIPPAYWPASGDLSVENLCARYSANGPEVLHNISFSVKSGERVGIVGRTGSGKSSLILSLLRCIPTEGTVHLDGMPTKQVNLDALRSNITIIPQVPELLSGTLRQNLDPFSQHDDAVLNDALRAAGLFNLQGEGNHDGITLDSPISGGGSNLSVGQRQILALARAIVRQSKLLILDEATSAIDYDTDTVIQTSLRKELKKDVTLLIVAHRLQTIMDADKIMVLDAGRMVEFDTPSELLKNKKGMLRALVDESGDKENLYAMAANAHIAED